MSDNHAARVLVVSALALAGFACLDTSVPSAKVGRRVGVRASYDLQASYPNDRRRNGYFLRGVNSYGSATSTLGPHPTSLWFQSLENGAFKQFNTAPYRTCHWDVLRWRPGERGVLVYLATHAECYALHTALVFQPGIVYMPASWTSGERWSDDGVSKTVYAENGTPVCAGTNTWHSHVVGLARMPNGGTAVHTQTDERQTLLPIAGAPGSASCPAGRPTRFGWQENFYIGGGLTVRRQDGSAIGSDTGLVRSAGGNPAATPAWDSVFDSWDEFPPASAGTVTTTPTTVANASTGNTITFTYTAPSSGLQDGSVAVVVPAGWTPPVTIDATGCTVATAGTVTTTGQGITVSALTLGPAEQVAITYGATSGASCAPGDGATAPPAPGAPVWQVQATLRQGVPFTNLPSSASINVEAP